MFIYISMLYLIRHAQASYLSDNYDQLSDLGIEQAKALGKHLADTTRIDHLYIGPHHRQQQTAEEIQKAYNHQSKPIASPIFIPELKEHSGPATLREHKAKLIQKDPQCIQWHQETVNNPETLRANSIKIFEYFIPKWMNNEFQSQDLEDFSSFRNEIAIGLKKVLNSKSPDSNSILVTSAGSISTIIAQLTNIQDTKMIAKLSFEIYNASITTLHFRNDSWQIQTLNFTDHLRADWLTIV